MAGRCRFSRTADQAKPRVLYQHVTIRRGNVNLAFVAAVSGERVQSFQRTGTVEDGGQEST